MKKEKELRFNFNPSEEQLGQYFDLYDYRQIGKSPDEVVDTIIKIFAADEWRWVSVESDGQTIAVIPMPCDDGIDGFSFKISLFHEKNAAAFILFMILGLIHSNSRWTTDYERDFIENLEKKSYLILEPGFELIDKTLGVDLGKLFSKVVGVNA